MLTYADVCCINYNRGEIRSRERNQGIHMQKSSIDWCKSWPAERTIMLRMTSKKVKEAVDKFMSTCLPPEFASYEQKIYVIQAIRITLRVLSVHQEEEDVKSDCSIS